MRRSGNVSTAGAGANAFGCGDCETRLRGYSLHGIQVWSNGVGNLQTGQNIKKKGQITPSAGSSSSSSANPQSVAPGGCFAKTLSCTVFDFDRNTVRAE